MLERSRHDDLCTFKMSAEVKKRRSWGKSLQRDAVTVLDGNGLKDTLKKLEEEARENKSRIKETLKVYNNGDSNTNPPSLSSLELQQPELMSNDRLVDALTKIKVPIPVYPDGSPSRERLLYLYRTYVLPRPQRARRQWRQARRRGKRKNDGQVYKADASIAQDCWENGDVVEDMEVEAESLKDISRTRKLPLDSEDNDLMPPIKRLLLQSPSTDTVPSSNTHGSFSSNPTPTSPTANSAPSHKTIRIKVKRSSATSSSSAPTLQPPHTSQPVGKAKIMWP